MLNIGLDIGSSLIKVVAVEKQQNDYIMRACGMIPLKNGIIVNNTIIDPKAVILILKNLFKQNRIKDKNVVLSISGEDTFLKGFVNNNITQTKNEFLTKILWDSSHDLPFKSDDIQIDLQFLPINEYKNYVLLAGAKREFVDDYIHIVKKAGLHPHAFDIDAVALINSYELTSGFTKDAVIPIINIGAEETNIVILDRGYPVYAKDIKIGGNDITFEIQKMFHLDFEQAETLKISSATYVKNDTTDALPPSEIGGIIRYKAEEFVSRINDSLRSELSDTKKISYIVLTGGSSKLNMLTRLLSEMVGVTVVKLNTFSRVKFDRSKFNSAHLENISPFFSVAMGLALK